MTSEDTRGLPDTVENAAATSGQDTPWKEPGLKEDKYQCICDILGHRPTNAELAMYSVIRSEHCSCKSFEKYLAEQFDMRTIDAMRKNLLVGMGRNADVVDIGGGQVVAFKIESHNHPSFVEPCRGMVIDVGGIIHDVISMSACPITVMDQLHSGAVNHPGMAYVAYDVVFGVGRYGNCLGLPNIDGEAELDSSRRDNPFANALRIGKLCHGDAHLTNATGEGNLVVLLGVHTDGDGIGSASILASKIFEDGTSAKRSSVQMGDPPMEKVLIECCLDLFEAGVAQDTQDLGAAGVSCVTSELTFNGGPGMHVDLENALLCGPTPTAGEILMNEPQRCMMMIVTPEDRECSFEIIGKWGVEAAVTDHLTGNGRPTTDHHGHRIVDIDPKIVTYKGPVYDRPYARSTWQNDLQVATSEDLSHPAMRGELIAGVHVILSDINQVSKAWIIDQYDRYVQGNIALAQPDGMSVICIGEESGLGVALPTNVDGWYVGLDPAAGAHQTLAESYCSVTVVSTEPVAITDCLNLGNPEDTNAVWQLVVAMTAPADGCTELEIPVTDGDVSLCNPSDTEKDLLNSLISPTPAIGTLSILPGATCANPPGFTEGGLAVILLGATREEFDGFVQVCIACLRLGGLSPKIDLRVEVVLGNVACALSVAGGLDG